MKRLDAAMIAVATAVALGCNVGPRNQASLESDQPEAVGTAGLAEGDDKAFVDRMAAAGVNEVQLSEMAKQRAGKPEVRHFADMMVRDHTAAGNKLRQLASRHAIPVSPQMDDEKLRETAERLSKLQGEDFDRAYMRVMVENHENVVDLLQTRAKEDRFGDDKGRVRPEQGDDPVEASLNNWAAETLLTARHHLDEAKRLHLALENVFGAPAGAPKRDK